MELTGVEDKASKYMPILGQFITRRWPQLTQAEVIDLSDKLRRKLRILRHGFASVALELTEDELIALIIAVEKPTICP